MNSLHLSCLCLLAGSCQQEFSYKMCLYAKDCPHGLPAISWPLSLLFCSFLRQNSAPVLIPLCFICIDRRWPFSHFSAPVPVSMGQRTTRGQSTGNAWPQRKKGCGLALGSFWRNLSRGCFGLGLGIPEEEVPSLLLWSSKGDRCIAGLGYHASATVESVRSSRKASGGRRLS